MVLDKALISSDSVVINASPERVWEVLTNPHFISQYLYGAQTITDWKVGSPVVFKIHFEESEFEDKGIIVENNQHQLLSYQYWSGFCGLEDKPENYSLVSYQLNPTADGKTGLVWSQEGFANEQSRESSQNALHGVLAQIKMLSEQ